LELIANLDAKSRGKVTTIRGKGLSGTEHAERIEDNDQGSDAKRAVGS
jgi:hypothetical protein